MLFLLFKIGHDRYALPASQMVEVVPLVKLKKIPRAPEGLAGIFNYHGQPVPVIDLTEISTGKPAEPRVSTRIVLMNYKAATGEQRILGLMAEQTSETIRRGKTDFLTSGVSLKAAPYLSDVLMDARGIIQVIEVDRLLSEPVREALAAANGTPNEPPQPSTHALSPLRREGELA